MLEIKRLAYPHTPKLILNTVLLVGLASVFFVSPFDNHFRFTFGVVVLSTLLLYFSQLPIVTTATLSGLVIMTTRITIYILSDASQYNLLTSVVMSLPAFCYYVFFGLFFYILRIRKDVNDIPIAFLKLSFADFVSNILEIFVRHTFSISESVGFLPNLVGVAIFRTTLSIYGYYALKRYRAFVLAEEHLKRYTLLIMTFAELKTEMYFLQKSSKDIEDVMARSFLLYQQLDSGQTDIITREETAGQLLQIAKDIHEVKKDYYRIMMGMEDMLVSADREKGMCISEIFYMIEHNTKRVLNNYSKKIKVLYELSDDLRTEKHYAMISILNNLIINSIEACEEKGQIKVSQAMQKNEILFCVEDNGCGIDPKELEMIFMPGYSTKHSSDTGRVSTGLGLAHVKNLTESMGGEVKVTSELKKGTKVFVLLPLDSLRQG